MATLKPKIEVDLGLDKAGLDKGLSSAKHELEGLGNQADKTAGKLSRIRSSLGKAGGFLGGAGMVAAGTVIGAAAIKAFGIVKSQIGSVIQAASDMNETVSKTEAVFGDNAEAVKKWGDTAASSVGLSKQAALEGASTVGNLLKGVGVANAELPKMSTNLVQAAADLGSFNNADPAEVLENLRSGLVGEAEPLRKYGILINEAAVQQKALELGLAGANGELSDGAKVQARYALIMEQMGDAAGDFAKTSGGLANGTRILSANIQNMKARIGAGLVPILAKATGGVNKLFAKFDEFSAQGQGGFLAAVNTLQFALSKVFGANAATSITGKLLDFRDAFLTVVDAIKRNMPAIKATVMTLAKIWVTGAQIIFQVLRSLVKLAGWAWSKIEGPVRRFVAFLRGLDFKHGTLGDLIDIFQALAKGDWSSAWKEIKASLEGIWSTLVGLPWGKIFSTALDYIIAGVMAVGDWLFTVALPYLAGKGAELIGALIDAIWNQKTAALLYDVGRFILSALWTGVASLTNWLAGQVSKIPGMMIDAITWAFNWFYNIGAWLLHGLASGVLSVAQSLANAVVGAVSGAIQAGKDALGINSPSKVFAAMGSSIGEGFVKGINGSRNDVNAALSGLAGGMNATVSGSLTMNGGGAAGRAGGGNSSSKTYAFAAGAIQVNGAQNPDAVAREILKAVDRVRSGESK